VADRYWVGGTGTWNTTSTTNWSASSGGASGASVPTAADNVFFDQASTYTVTMTGALTCLDITVSAGTVTFATGTSPTLAISGSMSLLAGTVWSSTGVITFNSTSTGRTITTNGVAFPGDFFAASSIIFNGVGGAWTLGSALTCSSGSISLVNGTLTTANYALSTGKELISNSGTARTLNLGSSIVSVGTSTSGGDIINFSSTNFTFNAGTSDIKYYSSASFFQGGGLTFYSVTLLAGGTVIINGNNTFTNLTATSGAVTINGSNTINGTFSRTSTNINTITFSASNTFNNFSITGPSSVGMATITFGGTQTINGTLSTTGTAGNRRVFFASATYGISVDLVVNASPSLTDADFRNIYVRGTSAPLTGTRIGNRGECRGITFSTAKTVYWNLAGAQNWSANGWATTSTGAPSTDNFPLPQDTATFTNAGSVTGTITLNTAIGYVPTVDMSGRTSAMTLGTSNATTVYGNWTNGSGTAFTGTSTLTFSGGTTQTITSASKTFTCPITVDTYGGTVQLADALNIGSNTLTVTNGTFTTNGFTCNIGGLSSSNSNVRSINLGASSVLVSSTTFALTTITNLTFNAGTSTINFNNAVQVTFNSGGLTFYNVIYSGVNGNVVIQILGANTFNNLTLGVSGNTQPFAYSFSANQTINGTLTCAGVSAVRRIFLRSDTVGTQRTLTVNSISATDCDFRDINLAGTASGASPTRAGNCGGNSGITFSSKTVYWNLAGAQNWSATGWCPSSGGTPDINQFPLAQDTAVFDNTGSVTGTITVDASWNIGTFDASGRTSAMTLTTSTNVPVVYGDWKFGTGVTSSSTTGTIAFSKNGTQTITSNGVQFGCPVTINHPSGTVQLADALSLGATRTLTVTIGTFDAVTYNVTTGLFISSAANSVTKMGSGTWTLSGTGTVWTGGTGFIFVGTSTIVLSDTSTSARTFAGGGLYYNKLTIGGTTGTSTLTITGANTFGELASTKTVAHTITFPSSSTTTVGKWSVTGTVGNVVTLAPSTAATAYTLSIAGPANTGIDYLSVSYCAVSTTSPGEFYVGANSTNTAGNTGAIIFTATPAARTLYWVGGTGNWSSTTKWSTSSGGSSGAAIPTSLDAVNFDSASNATAYTATIDAGVTIARCAAFTMAGPLSGNVTFAGSVGIAFHGNVSFAATGITRTYTGAMQWAGNSSYTFTTNGVTLASACTVTGVGATWTLGSALNIGAFSAVVTYGTFSTSASNYALTCATLSSNNTNVRSISLNGSTVTLSFSNPITFTPTNLTFNAGTSAISSSATSPTFSGGIQTFWDVSFTSAAATSITITGANTFNTLSFAGRTTVGITPVTFDSNQTITTLTLNAGTASAYRTFLASDTLGTQRTLTVTTLTAGAADYDFRDIAIAGGAAPIAPTRAGDCKGNSGITFPGAKTVYYRNTGSANWVTTGTGSWSATSGGASDATQFPLAQDTAVFPAATYPASGSTTTISANFNIGTIDMSLRTTNTMTLATSTNTPVIYGNWINGTGTTLTGTATLLFAGRASQTITSAGKAFTQTINVNTPSGSVTLQDAFSNASSVAGILRVNAGTFDASSYNVTLSGAAASFSGGTLTNTRTVAVGSGTWTIAGTGGWDCSTSTNLTVTGTGTISLTSASAKTFTGGSISYSGITLDQGGAGTLTISGNNTFKDITNTYSATGATTIALAATTQTVTQFTGTGTSGKVLTISGTSAGSPGTLIMSGAAKATTSDYLTISNVRAYSLTDTWYAGNNSTNSGSLGWYFVASGGTTYNVTVSDTVRGSETVVSVLVTAGAISESAQGSDSISSSFLFLGSVSESAQGSDQFASVLSLNPVISESAQTSDSLSSLAVFNSSLSDTARTSDSISSLAVVNSSLSETAQSADTVSSLRVLPSSISESVIVADTVSSIQVIVGSILETLQASDTFTAARFTFPQISESTRASDSISSRAVFRSSLLETIQASDTFTAARFTFPQISESARASDSISSLAVLNSSLSDTTRASDSISSLAIFNSSLLDTAQGADAVSSLRVLPGNISESVRGSDSVVSVFAFATLVSESVRGSDTVSTLSVFNAAAIEAVSGIDSFSTAATFSALFIDTIQGVDTFSAKATFRSNLSDDVRATDLNNATATFRTNLQESAQASDQTSSLRVLPGSISETVQISESITAQEVLYPVIQESARGSETFSTVAVFVSSISEQTTGQDAFTVAASTFNAAFVETVRGADTTVGFITFPASVSDTARGSDTDVGFLVRTGAIAESAQGADQFSALATFVTVFADTIRAADTMTVAPSTFNATFVETVRVLDVPNNTAVLLSSVTESILVYDAVLGVYQWNPIPTDQPGNWQAIATDASGSWQAIGTDQSGGWQLIPTSQGADWQLIDDSQDPQWQNILTVPN
jgi:hypothetical protein